MANHKSSEKRAVISRKRARNNSDYQAAVRTSVKKFQVALNSFQAGGISDVTALKSLFVNAQSMLAKAATKGVIKKGNASRKTGRLAQAFKTAVLAKKKK